MIIYADILFLINFLSCYVMISIMCRYKQRKLSSLRKISGSLCGAIASLVIFLADLEHYIVTAIFLLASVTIMLMCFGKKALLFNCIIFLMLFMLCGSAITLFVALAGGSTEVLIKNNILYFDIDEKIFVCCFVSAYPLVCIFFKLIEQRSEKKLHSLTLINGGKTISINALFDSGNLLKEPISGADVIILEDEYAKKIVTENQEFIDIPYSTITGIDNMQAFLCDMVIIDDKHILRHRYIGIAKGCLCNTDEYCALIGNMGGF